MSLFDGYKKETMAAVTGVMGQEATWIPSDGSAPAGHKANVLLKNPTKEEKLNGVPYDPTKGQIEFHKDYLPGLFDAVRSGSTELISIGGLSYLVEAVHKEWDGDITMAEVVRSS